MKRLIFLTLAAAIVASCLNAWAEGDGPPPNVVLIFADDLGYSGLHDWGSDFLETPNIDAIGEAGMRFTNGLAAYPECKPTRGALLTGQYGSRTGIHRVVDRHAGNEDKIRFVVPANHDLSPSAITLAEVFRDHGYTTAMYGKWHVADNDEGHPIHHGFDEAIVSQSAHFNFRTWPEMPIPEPDMTAGEYLTDKAIEFMQSAVASKKPFFLYMPYFLIHKPLESRTEDIAHFEQKLAGSDDDSLPVVAAMTRDLDRLVGRLDAALNQMGVSGNTLVVFTSDNGSYNENLVGGFRGKKGQVYEGGMRVPYAFRFPGRIDAGTLADDRIITVDLYPTLLDFAGITLPADTVLDGTSLKGLLTAQKKSLPERPLICFFPKYTQFQPATGLWRDSWRNVLYRGDYKYIAYPEYGTSELFNLADDPGETNNLAGSESMRLEAMRYELEQILRGMNVPAPEPNPDYLPQKG